MRDNKFQYKVLKLQNSFAIENDNNMAYDILTNGTKLYLYEISVHSAAKLLCRKAQFLNKRRQNVLRFIIVITIVPYFPSYRPSRANMGTHNNNNDNNNKKKKEYNEKLGKHIHCSYRKTYN